MISSELEAQIRSRMTTAKILWAVFTWTIVGFMLFSYFFARPETETLQVPETPLNLLLPLLVLGALDLCAALGLRVYLRQTKVLRKGILPTSSPEAQFNTIAPRWFLSLLIPMALHETIALQGLVLSLVTKNFASALPFFLVAFVLTLTLIPRESILFDALESAPIAVAD
jgi:NADH:ubiquinone oxidoreductase subunit 5 (subunit L)/multisubunit Na+/H+ antiporter MnhA subunit